jgi:signal transduction histidine kinase
MNLSTNIGQAFSNKYQFDSAATYYNIGIENAIKVQDSSAIGYLFNSIGVLYWKKGEFNLAIEKFKAGVEVHRKFGNNKRIVRSLNNLGSSYWNLKNYNIALQYYFEAVEVEKKYAKINSSLILNNIGILYLELSDTVLAKVYFEKGLKSAEVKNSILGKGYSYLNFADLNFKKQNFDEALKFYNRAFTYYDTLKDTNGISKILNKLGQVYLTTSNYTLAEKKFLAAYQKSKTFGLKLIETESLINICRIQILQGKNDKARTYLDRAFKIAESENFVDCKLELFKLQTTVYENLKNYKLALDYHYKYEILRDSLFDEQSTRVIAESKEKYEVEQKEEQNRSLKYVNNIQKLELHSRKSEILYAIVLAIFSLIVIGYLIFLNTNRKRQNNALLKANKEIEEVNKLLNHSNSTKDKFFSIISHDLKNPFGTLLGATQILKVDDGEMSTEDKTELVEIIASDSEKLYALLENLLFWANSQTGKLKANKTNIPINELITEIAELFKSNAKSKNIKLELSVPKELAAVFDMFMFSTIIRNLLSNAIKFSLHGGTITITATELFGKVSIQVKDEGIGIVKKNLAKIFDESSDYKRLGTDKETGTGLGLILCRDFASENSADIKVTSEVGKGTTFELIMEKGN